MASILRCSILAAGVAIGFAGCGLPDPPNIREEFSNRVKALGVTPVYPMRENVRLGQVYLVDRNAGTPGANRSPAAPTSILLSDAMTVAMENARTNRVNTIDRFAASGKSVAALIQGAANFQQPAGDTLELIGMPKYSLASVDQAALSGTFPLSLANIAAGLGFSRNSYLTVEAEATAMAELPLDTFTRIVGQSCLSNTPGSLGNLIHSQIPTIGEDMMSAKLSEAQSAPFEPAITIVWQVYYLRGIKFTYNDSKAAAAALNAALNTRLDASRTPPAPPSPSVATPATTPSGSGTMGTDLQSQMTDLTQRITDLNSKLATGNNNVNIASSFLRATATGIELVQLFDRPLAFGYAPMTLPYHDGIRKLCELSGAT